jgi:hypothetical protein
MSYLDRGAYWPYTVDGYVEYFMPDAQKKEYKFIYRNAVSKQIVFETEGTSIRKADKLFKETVGRAWNDPQIECIVEEKKKK